MLLVVAVVLAAASTCGADGLAITNQYPNDTITVLWYALGMIASFVSLVLGMVGLWSLKKIMEHDKDIVAIKTRCGIEHPTKEEPEL